VYILNWFSASIVSAEYSLRRSEGKPVVALLAASDADADAVLPF